LVTVTGTPTLQLNTGNNGKATYLSGSGTKTLTFGYTVTAQDTTADLAVLSPVINGGTITDTAGNAVDLTGALVNPAGTLQIDTIEPSQPSGPVLALASDSGTQGDKLTNVTTPTFTGTAETGSTVSIFSGSTLLGSGVATSGSYSVAITSALSQGDHIITATATDGAGNVSGLSTGIKVTIDAIAPSAPSVPDLQAPSDTGSSSTDNITNVTKPVFTGTGGENGATVTLLDGAVAIGTGTVGGDGKWTITATTALTEGANTITATQTDVAGNVSAASAGLSVAIHTTAPPALPDLMAAFDSGPSDTDNITNLSTLKFSGTTWANSTVTLSEGQTNLGTGKTDANGSWTIVSSVLGQGTHNITATVNDGVGFTSGVSPVLSVTIDTAAPTPPTIGAIGGVDSAVSGQAGDNTVTGKAEQDSTVAIMSGTTTLGTTTATGAGIWTYALTAANLTTLGQGSQTVTATATDAAGNTSGAATPFGFSVDTAPPSVPSITSVTDDVLPGTGTLVSGVSTNDTDLTVRVNVFATGAVAGDAIRLFNGAGTSGLLSSYTLLSGDITRGFADLQTGVLATPGTYDITARLIDQAGNLSGASSGFTVTEDASAVCYAAGTRILTATGERTVETLMRGDIVLTLSGGELCAQPVKWIGQRRIDLTAHPHPETVAPIRIARGAFADNMPHRDLLVSPDHAVFVDGKLICARQLVNGSTIRQEKGWTSVEYFHVELDAHAILLAEGLPAESYLNTGNRGFFANSGEPLVLHPDLTDEADYPTREAASCAPFVSDEASVRPVWQRLAERAAALGQPAPKPETTGDPELRIVAKGRTVRPLYGENGLYIFALPKGTTEVRLISRAGAPTDARPWLDDRRCLGVNVERIVLRGASELREIPVDHPDLSQGWQAAERAGAALRRWTNGDAMLPLPALSGPTMLEIRAGNGGMTYVTSAEQERRAA
jgi:hypothetical protein